MEKLPNELISYTIELLVEDYGFQKYHSALSNTSLVCRAWHQIVVSNPRLWSAIYVSTLRLQKPLIQQSLVRSKVAPLDVFINLSSDNDSAFEDGPDIRRALQIVRPYQHRFRSLEFDVDFRENLRDALATLCPHFPKLESINCTIHFNAYDGVLLHFPHVKFPALREIHLYNIPMAWQSIVAPNLRKLTFHLHPNSLCLDPFLQFLSSTLRLEHLEIASPSILDYTTTIDQLNLPRLRILKIRPGRQGDLVNTLLSHINAPNLRVLYISYQLKPHHEIKFTNYFPRLEHLSLVWINQSRDLLPKLASQMPNLRSLMLVGSFDLPPLGLRFLGRRQENGKFPFPRLTTLMLRRVKLFQILDLTRARRQIKELFLFPSDLYVPSLRQLRAQDGEQRWLSLCHRVKVKMFFSLAESYKPDDDARELLFQGNMLWANFALCEKVWLEEYLESKYGLQKR